MDIEYIKEKFEKYHYIAGCDEAGAGVLAGDLVVASIILPKKYSITGLTDSKKLSSRKRDYYYELIKEKAIDYNIFFVSHTLVDKINILQARMWGMKSTIENLKRVDYVIFDGNRIPYGINVDCDCLIKDDLYHSSVSAASILAKVSRDRQIVEQSYLYPGYGFKQHKEYGTKKNLESLAKLSPCPINKKSYNPVKDMLYK